MSDIGNCRSIPEENDSRQLRELDQEHYVSRTMSPSQYRKEQLLRYPMGRYGPMHIPVYNEEKNCSQGEFSDPHPKRKIRTASFSAKSTPVIKPSSSHAVVIVHPLPPPVVINPTPPAATIQDSTSTVNGTTIHEHQYGNMTSFISDGENLSKKAEIEEFITKKASNKSLESLKTNRVSLSSPEKKGSPTPLSPAVWSKETIEFSDTSLISTLTTITTTTSTKSVQK